MSESKPEICRKCKGTGIVDYIGSPRDQCNECFGSGLVRKCTFCGTINDAHHSAEYIDTDGKCYQPSPPQREQGAVEYKQDIEKDISFLREMKETFDKIKNGNGWDRMQMDHLGTMIEDWLHELEKINLAPPTQSE